MKSIIISCAAVLAPLCAAAADHDAGPIGAFSVVPETGTLQELGTVHIRFTGTTAGIDEHPDLSGVILTRKGDMTVYTVADSRVSYSDVYLDFALKGDDTPTVIKENGTYTLDIPAGVFTSVKDPSVSNSAIHLEYVIDASATTTMSAFRLTPEPGEIEELASVNIVFPDSKNGIDIFSFDTSGITLTSAGSSFKVAKATPNFKDSSVTMTFAPAGETGAQTITTPGTYRLHIPAGTFKEDFTGVSCDEINADYTIPGQGTTIPAEFADMVAVPADGAAVGALKTVEITFPNMADGIDYPIADAASITLQRKGDDTVYHANTTTVGGPGLRTLSTGFNLPSVTVSDILTFTEAGEYEMTIPAGVVRAYGSGTPNQEIKLSFTVDPMLNFTCRLSPSSGSVSATYPAIKVTPGEGMGNIRVRNTGTHATLTCGEQVITLDAADAADGQSVSLTAPADTEIVFGTWELLIPSGMLEGENSEGTTLYNYNDITASYTLQAPEKFSFTLTPDNEVVDAFTRLSASCSGKGLKKVAVDTEAGTPLLTSAGGSEYPLEGKVSGKTVNFTLVENTVLPDGVYTASIPAGYIVSTDTYGLTAPADAATASFTIKRPVMPADASQGMLVINEGWFGHDNGSINFFGNDGDTVYDIFSLANPGKCLGATSQYGQCHGDRIYVVSKQTGSGNGVTGGQLAVLDAQTLELAGQIDEIDGRTSGARAFCAWDTHKGYITTDKGIFIVNLDEMSITAPVNNLDIIDSFDTFGEMAVMGDYVFVTLKYGGVAVIDPAQDDITAIIPAELATTLVTTADGSLYAATQDEESEFVRITTTEPFATSSVNINEDKCKIANIWTTWKKAPIAAAKDGNAVFYTTVADNATTVARYDFDSDTFTRDFITLPGTADGEQADWVLYGSGISVDPATGLVVLMAVEKGYGTHYRQNRIYYADPSDGHILTDKTVTLRPYYWFPSMALYPCFSAPSLTLPESYSFTLDGNRSATINMTEAATLPVGNPHMIRYTAISSDPEICTVNSTAPGIYEIQGTAIGAATVTVTASYPGKTSRADIAVNVGATSLDAVGATAIRSDVYDTRGMLILRDAHYDDISKLSPGIYIANGKKIVIK